MHPLFFVGIALAVVGAAISASGKKTPANNTPQEGGVAPNHTEEPPVECGEAEVVNDEEAPDNDEKKQALLNMLPANLPPEFEGLDPEDVERLYAEKPQAVLDPLADIAVEVSRFCGEKGESAKEDEWWRYSQHLRRPPKSGK